MSMNKCEKCRYALWDYDDAYGATIRWVEGCEKAENGEQCPYEDGEDDV